MNTEARSTNQAAQKPGLRAWHRAMRRPRSFLRPSARSLLWRIGSLVLAFSLQPSAFAQDSVCAQVKIEMLQELTLEREAFEARMTINNGLQDVALDSISVDVSFADRSNRTVRATSNPNDTSALFFIRYQNGSGIPASIPGGTTARILWLIIPAPGAGGANPQGELYYVGAALRYRASGQTNEVQVTPDTI